MRLIKGFVFVFLGFSIVLTAISLLMPSTVVVNRTEIIAVDSATTSHQVKHLKNWINWHPYFAEVSPEHGFFPNGKAYLKWEMKGRTYRFEEVLNYANGIRVVFARSGENDIINDVTTYSAGLQNQVEWKAINNIKWYPWEKFGAMFLNDISGPAYEDALKSLKHYLEKNPSAR